LNPPPNDKQTFENYAILLAEDNVFNRHVAIEILKQAGFTQVDIAENGKKVIEALKKKDISFNFDGHSNA
jgi:CheY-like chemotaxis protein